MSNLHPRRAAGLERREPLAVPLARVTRGPVVESLHRGHVAVVDGLGRPVAHLGSPDAVTFLRSAAKPFQALPVLTTGAADHFGFSDEEIALLCGSHSGEPRHTETVRAMLEKLGLGEDALQCGAHPPYDARTAQRLQAQGEEPSALHNNCSGKHAGMLALALHLGASPRTYRAPDHPVQRLVLETVVRFSGLPATEIEASVDGCGVPTFAVPVGAMARLFARLVHPPGDLDEATRAACSRLTSAMMAHPEMVEGTDLLDCLDTAVMRALPGRIVSKVGAEGVYAAGVLPCAAWPHGLGIAFKIEDGDGKDRARNPVAMALLDRLRILDDAAREALARTAEKPICNHRGEPVGRVLPDGPSSGSPPANPDRSPRRPSPQHRPRGRDDRR